MSVDTGSTILNAMNFDNRAQMFFFLNVKANFQVMGRCFPIVSSCADSSWTASNGSRNADWGIDGGVQIFAICATQLFRNFFPVNAYAAPT